MNKTRLGLAILVLAVAVGGFAATNQLQCGIAVTERPHWELLVGVHDTRPANGSFVFHGEVGLTGSTGQPVVENVTVRFLDDDEQTLQAVSLGSFGVSRQHHRNVTVRLSRSPAVVRLDAKTVRALAESSWVIGGLERTPDDQYREIVVRESSC